MATWNSANNAIQATNKSLHETYVPVTRHGEVISGNFYLDVAKGLISGHEIVFLAGKNDNVATNSNVTVWQYGGLYPWSAWNAGVNNLFLSSNNAADVGNSILIDGLDLNYNKLSETIITNGITAVSSTNKFLRVNNVLNVGNTAFVGAITVRYGSNTGAVVGFANTNSQMMRSATYTVPAGHTAFSIYGDFAVSASDYAQLNAHWRLFGGVFLQVYSTETTGAFKADPLGPGAIPEKTDIDNRVSNGTNNLRCMSNQQLLLVNNNYL